MKNYKIPFNSDTNELMAYAGYSENVVWKENFEFEDVLKFDCFERGRSAAHAVFKSESTKRRYQMFLTDLADSIEFFSKGTLTGSFTFKKRGQNYGVILKKAQK